MGNRDIPVDVQHIRHKKFKVLPFYQEILTMFEEGQSLRTVAKFCRARGFFVEDGDSTLLSGLSRLRSDEVTGYNKEFKAPQRAKEKQDLIDPKSLIEIDTTDELERLYRLQLGRVNMAVKFERKMKVLNRNIVREVEACASILQRKHEVENADGNNGIVNNLTVRPEIELNLGEQSTKALSSPESASRVLSVAKGLARLGLGAPTESGTIDVLDETKET